MYLWWFALLLAVFRVYRQAVQDTKWANLKPMFSANCVFIVSKEPRVADLITLLKKMPQFVLLGTDQRLLYAAVCGRLFISDKSNIFLGWLTKISVRKKSQLTNEHMTCNGLLGYRVFIHSVIEIYIYLVFEDILFLILLTFTQPVHNVFHSFIVLCSNG